MSSGDVETTEFGRLAGGRQVKLYTVRQGKSSASFIDYGARIVSLVVPGGDGLYQNVVLGFDKLSSYERDKSFQGATIGRFGNRIGEGRFSIDGKRYTIPPNNGGNALHGGPDGFDRRLWAGKTIENGVEFSLLSEDGDQGFPGTMDATVRFAFVADALRIEYSATCDQPTIVNLTNHVYFNLSGSEEQTIVDHTIQIPAEHYTPVDEGLIPTGELRPVAGTAFDLREPVAIGAGVDASVCAQDEQLRFGRGYDHNWALGEPGKMKRAARLFSAAGSRLLTVETTEPGVQFYSGNFLDGSSPNRNGGMYEFRSGLCLETQHYPDSPNHAEFPSTLLRPGETYRSTTIYSFSVRR